MNHQMRDSYPHCEQCRTLSICVERAKDDLNHAARRLSRAGFDSPRRGMSSLGRLRSDVVKAREVLADNRATLKQHQEGCSVVSRN